MGGTVDWSGNISASLKVKSTWKIVHTFILMVLTYLDSSNSKQKMFDKILESTANARLQFAKGKARG